MWEHMARFANLLWKAMDMFEPSKTEFHMSSREKLCKSKVLSNNFIGDRDEQCEPSDS